MEMVERVAEWALSVAEKAGVFPAEERAGVFLAAEGTSSMAERVFQVVAGGVRCWRICFARGRCLWWLRSSNFI